MSITLLTFFQSFSFELYKERLELQKSSHECSSIEESVNSTDDIEHEKRSDGCIDDREKHRHCEADDESLQYVDLINALIAPSTVFSPIVVLSHQRRIPRIEPRRELQPFGKKLSPSLLMFPHRNIETEKKS